MTTKDKVMTSPRNHLIELLDDWDAALSAERQRKNEEAARLRAEISELVHQLETEKALIKSLRDDTKEMSCLKTSLRERDDVIAKLEECARRYAATIIDLKHETDGWKKKHATLQAANVDPDATSTELHALEDDDKSSYQWINDLDEVGNR